MSPDLQHMVTKKALWIDGWSTPAWVKARLTSVSQGGLHCHADYDTKDSQGTAERKRYWHEHMALGIEPSLFFNAKKLGATIICELSEF